MTAHVQTRAHVNLTVSVKKKKINPHVRLYNLSNNNEKV